MFRSLLIAGIVAAFCGASLADELDAQKSDQIDEDRKPSGKEYSLHCTKVNFMTAFRRCMEDGLQLATDESRKDSKKLAKLLIENNKDEPVWIAGTNKGAPDSWLFLSTMQLVGGIFDYFRWKDDEPAAGKNCMTADLNENHVRWSASDCDHEFCYVCQTVTKDRVDFTREPEE